MNAVSTHDHHPAEKPGYNLGGRAFVWLAWLVAFGFWALTLSTAFGILTAMNAPAVSAEAQADGAGGIGWSLMTIVVASSLGLALAWGAYKYATRNKRPDPRTEQATENLYDAVAAAGGDDEISTSPEAEKRGEPIRH